MAARKLAASQAKGDVAKTPAPVRTVDARGHRCPVPTLKLRRALAEVGAGDVVCLIADDPMARLDAPLFVREAGHELLETREDGGALTFLVRRAASDAPGD